VTATQPQARVENVGGGALLALLAIPVGVVALALIYAIGFFSSIVGLLIAYCAVWLYKRGSGGAISRVGAWIVTAIVVVTLVLGIWVTLVVAFAHGLGHLGNIGLDGFWPQFNKNLPHDLSDNVLFIVLTFLFGCIGAIRTLGRAFAIAGAGSRPATAAGTSPAASAPTVYRNDVDAAPTGSADDKTGPPTSGS
jgi:hypothetical protein